MGKTAPVVTHTSAPAEASNSASVASLLTRAEEIGRELRRLGGWQANRLTREAMVQQAVRVAGVGDLAELRELAAKATAESAPYLHRQIMRVVEGWRDPAACWVPGFHGCFTVADQPDTAAAYAERLAAGITPTQASGLAILALAEEPGGRFGECEAPGAVEARVAALQGELADLNARVLASLTLADLEGLVATVRVGGRRVAYSPRLAHDVAALA